MSKTIPSGLIFTIGVCLLGPLFPTPLPAATLTVNSNGSSEAEDGLCDLKEAIRAANTDMAQNPLNGDDCPAGSGDDIIDFDPAVTGTINFLQLAEIEAPVHIQGPGANILSIDRVGAAVQFSYLLILDDFPGTVRVSGLTFANAQAGGGNGGGISNSGNDNDLIVEDCVFTGNQAPFAGAISFLGRNLTVTNSTFSGNTATGSVSGALDLRPTGTPSTVIIQNSTINGNSSNAQAGAIRYLPADMNSKLSITNSTLSGNFSGNSGGAITCENGVVHFNNVTLVGNFNTGADGGGIFVHANCDGFNLRNSILANNNDMAPAPNDHNDCSGSVISQGYNLIEDPTGCVISGDTLTNILNSDPALSGLGANGGSSQTHLPLPLSPLIDAGNPAGCTDEVPNTLTTDQRGLPRPVDAACEIGAVEIECGNTFLEGNEECDDGNTADGDGCQANCFLPVCGDAIVDAGEACDDGNGNNNDACRNNCALPSCGDGIVDPGEDCDDGNSNNSDVCLNTCMDASCGDGVVEAGAESCDDGNGSSTDACLNNCVAASCGDGFIQSGVETCDDGNTANSDGCSSSCQTESTGGGAASANGCSLTKRIPLTPSGHVGPYLPLAFLLFFLLGALRHSRRM